MSLVGNSDAIDPSRHHVDIISCPKEAKPFVERHHYSGSYPATRASCGLFRSEGGKSQLVGVASFSVSMNPAAGPKNTGLPAGSSVELGRLVLLDHIEANAESWFVSRAFRRLREEKPEIEAVYAYSDPMIRKDHEGNIILPGHVGEVYQALSAKCIGRGRARTLLQMPDGRVASERAISKIRACDQGHEYAARQLLEAGADKRRTGEEPSAWIERLKREGFFKRVRHPGNWIYTFPLTRSARKVANDLASIEPPKRDPLVTSGDVTRLAMFGSLAA